MINVVTKQLTLDNVGNSYCSGMCAVI